MNRKRSNVKINVKRKIISFGYLGKSYSHYYSNVASYHFSSYGGSGGIKSWRLYNVSSGVQLVLFGLLRDVEIVSNTLMTGYMFLLNSSVFVFFLLQHMISNTFTGNNFVPNTPGTIYWNNSYIHD